MSLEPITPQHNTHASNPTPRPMRCALITASDTRTADNDTSGDLIAERLLTAGHVIEARMILRESLDEMTARLGELIAHEEIEVILITGGTGITRRDVTPDALAAHSTKEIPGFGELFRWLSYADIGASTIQSRACAHLCGETLVFALPGSTGAVKLAMDSIIIPQLDVRHKPCNFAQLMPRIKEVRS